MLRQARTSLLCAKDNPNRWLARFSTSLLIAAFSTHFISASIAAEEVVEVETAAAHEVDEDRDQEAGHTEHADHAEHGEGEHADGEGVAVNVLGAYAIQLWTTTNWRRCRAVDTTLCAAG
jgi:hypothetical protein